MATTTTRSRRAPATPARKVIDPLEKFINTLELEHLQCRDFGHSWRPFTARWMAEDRCYESQLRCGRCGTLRVRRLSRTGSQIGSHYDYPEGYVTKGMGRLTGSDRDKIRLASLLRVLVEDTADEGARP